jgi:dihydropteroate synthase
LLGTPVEQRLPASLACAVLAVDAGVQIIRTHDVAETVQAVRLAEAVLALKK